MANETYLDLMEIANQLVGPLLDIAPYGADCKVEVSQKLQERGFVRDGEYQKLKYVGEKVEIIYDPQADKLFSIIFSRNDSVAVLEAMDISSKLIEILEDI